MPFTKENMPRCPCPFKNEAYRPDTCLRARDKLLVIIFLTGLELLKEAIARAGYTDKVKIGMDVAASEFHRDKKYDLDFKNKDSDPSKFVSTTNSLLTMTRAS